MELQESLYTHYEPWELAEALDDRDIVYDWDDEYNHMDIYYTEDNKEMILRLVELSGWQVVKTQDGYFQVERKYGDDASSYYSRNCEGCTYPSHTNEFYHITSAKNVPRIMKYGLVPKDNKKMGMIRGDRVYLIDYPDDHLARQLKGDSDEKYVILSVDLSKMQNKPKLYHDDYAFDGCLYTTENIPPYCITVRTDLSESVGNKEIVQEYLDKEYGMPLFNKLNNSKTKYQPNFESSPDMIIGIFLYIILEVSDEECKRLNKIFYANPIGEYAIHISAHEFSGGKEIEVLNHYEFRRRRGSALDFIYKHRQEIYQTIFRNYADILDKFWFYINDSERNYKVIGDPRFREYCKTEDIFRHPNIFKPKWLLHFTPYEENAVDICANGFKKGMKPENIDKLAYSNSENFDKSGKYCYAYDAESFVDATLFHPRGEKNQWAFDNTSDQKAWERAMHYCVMFVGSGVEAYHMTDKEYQVIFNADTARNFVLIAFENQMRNEKDNRKFISFDKEYKKVLAWQVKTLNGDVIYNNPSLKNVVKWVMTNYDQYRKQIHQPMVDKVKTFNGYTKEELLTFLEKTKNSNNIENNEKLVKSVEKAFRTGESNRDLNALLNTISHLDFKKMDEIKNGYNPMKESKKTIHISESQEAILIKENIRIHKGEKGKNKSTQGKWRDSIDCPHCDGEAFFSMSISDGNRGRGRIKVTDEQGKEIDSEVQTIALYYCPKCHKFIAQNNMA